MDICCDCGAEAKGGELIPIETATGWRLAHRCWTCFLGPEPAPCCVRAQEQGYRRGYRHGYMYALWDLGRYVRISDSLWAQIEHFLYQMLYPWVYRARGRDGQHIPQENGPRFRTEHPRRRKGAAGAA
jgi:hypothetical protein